MDPMFVLDPAGKIRSMTTSANSTSVPYLDLNDGNRIPQLGFGVFQVPPDETAAAVGARAAHRLPLDRHRRDLPQRGRASARRSRDSGSSAASCTSRPSCGTTEQGRDRVPRRVRGQPRAARAGLRRPVPDPLAGAVSTDRYVETWKALIELTQSGRARSIGVSNFRPSTSSGSSTPPASCRRSTRSNCIRGSSNASCGATTQEHGDPHRGVEPARAGRAARRRRRRGDRLRRTIARRRRWSSAGTSSSATS